MSFTKNPWFIGIVIFVAGNIVSYLVKPVAYIHVIKWWPSGWLFSFLLVAIYLLYSSTKIRSWYLSRKFGPDHNGKLLISGDKIYLVINKEKRWIKNRKTVYELGYDYDQILRVSIEELNKYKNKKPLSVLFWE